MFFTLNFSARIERGRTWNRLCDALSFEHLLQSELLLNFFKMINVALETVVQSFLLVRLVRSLTVRKPIPHNELVVFGS